MNIFKFFENKLNFDAVQKQRYAHMIKKYGKVTLITHICLSNLSLLTCYFMVSKGLDVSKYLKKLGINLQSDKQKNLSDLALAFVIHKTIFPLRLPVTIAVVPLVIKCLKYFR